MDATHELELLDELKDIHAEVDKMIDKLGKEMDEYETSMAESVKSLGDMIASTDGQLEAIETEMVSEIDTFLEGERE